MRPVRSLPPGPARGLAARAPRAAGLRMGQPVAVDRHLAVADPEPAAHLRSASPSALVSNAIQAPFSAAYAATSARRCRLRQAQHRRESDIHCKLESSFVSFACSQFVARLAQPRLLMGGS